MKIIFDEAGQMCNRFWSYLSVIDEAIDKKESVKVLFYDASLRYFDNLRHNNIISFPFYIQRLQTEIGIRRYQKIIRCFLANRCLRLMYSTSIFMKMGFVNGWNTRGMYTINKNFEMIQELFVPNVNIREEVEKVLNPYKGSNKLLIGLHIRRGDYKKWYGGRYFLSNDIIRYIIIRMVSLFPEKHVSFFISTNEPECISQFSEFRTICIDNASPAHDLYGLSLCDYIIGPISSFSKWASFIGRVPVLFFSKEKANFTHKDFAIVVNNDYFDNNKLIPNPS